MHYVFTGHMLFRFFSKHIVSPIKEQRTMRVSTMVSVTCSEAWTFWNSLPAYRGGGLRDRRRENTVCQRAHSFSDKRTLFSLLKELFNIWPKDKHKLKHMCQCKLKLQPLCSEMNPSIPLFHDLLSDTGM